MATVKKGAKLRKHNDGTYSIIVDPITNIETAIKRGQYNRVGKPVYSANLRSSNKRRRIWFLPVTIDVEEGREEEYAAERGYAICEHASAYLFGAMAVLSPENIPAEFREKDAVAVEKTGSFKNAYLAVSFADGKRVIDTVNKSGPYDSFSGWLLVVEKKTA